jgi:hypothetical protein
MKTIQIRLQERWEASRATIFRNKKKYTKKSKYKKKAN